MLRLLSTSVQRLYTHTRPVWGALHALMVAVMAVVILVLGIVRLFFHLDSRFSIFYMYPPTSGLAVKSTLHTCYLL